jgi:predicted nucleic acid-binding protein
MNCEKKAARPAFVLDSSVTVAWHFEDETVLRAWHDTMHLARAHNLSVYDASYLELALRRGLPLASLDDHLKEAAAAIGVEEVKP